MESISGTVRLSTYSSTASCRYSRYQREAAPLSWQKASSFRLPRFQAKQHLTGPCSSAVPHVDSSLWQRPDKTRTTSKSMHNEAKRLTLPASDLLPSLDRRKCRDQHSSRHPDATLVTVEEVKCDHDRRRGGRQNAAATRSPWRLGSIDQASHQPVSSIASCSAS